MAEFIELTPTITAVMLTEDDLLSENELKEVLRTIPDETLEEHGLVKGDTPAAVDEEGQEYAELLIPETNAPTRMKREGYTISDKSDYYWFGHKKWSSRGGKKPNKIIPHHHAGNLTPKQFLAIMQSTRQMSPTVSVHTDGTVYAWVPEEMRPWTSGSYEADQTALTLEIANDEIGGNWHISDKAYKLSVQICAEWCKRYGITPSYKAGRKGTIQMHKEWANTACPGPYLSNKITSGQFTKDINAILNPAPKTKIVTLYKVQCGAFTNKANAVSYQLAIKKAGFDAIIKSEGNFHRVQVGAFQSEANAKDLLAKVRKAGFNGILVTVKQEVKV